MIDGSIRFSTLAEGRVRVGVGGVTGIFTIAKNNEWRNSNVEKNPKSEIRNLFAHESSDSINSWITGFRWNFTIPVGTMVRTRIEVCRVFLLRSTPA